MLPCLQGVCCLKSTCLCWSAADGQQRQHGIELKSQGLNSADIKTQMRIVTQSIVTAGSVQVRMHCVDRLLQAVEGLSKSQLRAAELLRCIRCICMQPRSAVWTAGVENCLAAAVQSCRRSFCARPLICGGTGAAVCYRHVCMPVYKRKRACRLLVDGRKCRAWCSCLCSGCDQLRVLRRLQWCARAAFALIICCHVDQSATFKNIGCMQRGSGMHQSVA